MPQRLYAPTASVRNITAVVDVNKGGTGATNDLDAADNLAVLSKHRVNVPQGAVGLDGSGFISSAVLPRAAVVIPTLDGPDSIATNEVVNFTITNYDANTNYTVSVSVGSVVRNGATITYTAPATVQSCTMNVNGREVTFSIGGAVPVTPTIVSPTNNATNIASAITITTSDYSFPGQGTSHLNSDWQLATDSLFNNIVISSMSDTVNKTSWLATGYNVNTDYYVRVRHRASDGRVSAWSNNVRFTTKTVFVPEVEEGIIVASDRVANDQFGLSLALSSDGSRLIVGCPGSDHSTYTDPGAAYVFVRSGSTWTLEQKILPYTGLANVNYFGNDVDIDDAGTRVIIGCYNEDSGGSNSGGAYIFVRSGTTWASEYSCGSVIEGTNAEFGYSVAISGDGNYAVVGARYSGQYFSSGGGAEVYSRSGSTWTRYAPTIYPSDLAASDYFGFSVAIDATGTRMVICSQGADVGGQSNAGAAYVFIRSGNSWTQEAKLTRTGATSGDNMSSVTIDGTGTYVACGFINGVIGGITNPGSVAIFKRTGTSWVQEDLITASDRAANDIFGVSVSMNTAGDRLVVGSYLADVSGTSNAGASYLFTRNGTLWTQQAKMTASNRSVSAQFGLAISMSGDGTRVAAGAPYGTAVSPSSTGCAYVFK